MNMNGPPPSKLVLLQDLYKQPLQSKVRFLGCVSYYDTLSGRLLLEYPLSAAEAAEVAESRGLTTTKPTSTRTSSEIQKRKKTKGVRALDQEIRVATIAVDIGNILESIQRDDVQIGTWLNVLGYIRQESNSSDAESNNALRGNANADEVSGGEKAHNIYIDAVIVFPARAIRIDEYDRIVREAQEVDRRIERPQ